MVVVGIWVPPVFRARRMGMMTLFTRLGFKGGSTYLE